MAVVQERPLAAAHSSGDSSVSRTRTYVALPESPLPEEERERWREGKLRSAFKNGASVLPPLRGETEF